MDTRVSVVARPGGSGTLGVTVTFDDAAVKALGGQTVLARQLQYADLESAGWKVSGPSLLADGGASVTVTRGFSSGAQLSNLMAGLAGSSSVHPFRLSFSDNGGFWTHKTVMQGAVDLRCGLGCFGDPGLQASLGGPLGVAAPPLEGSAGTTAAQVFHFDLAARLPGRPNSSSGNPAVARDGTLTWTAPLGSHVTVGAVSESVDWGHVVLVSVLAALVMLGGGFGGWRVRRHRRRNAAPGDVELVPALVGEPVPADPGGDLTSWPRL